MATLERSRLAVLLLLFTVVASACGSPRLSPSPPVGATPPGSVEETVAALGASGIAVYKTSTAETPVGPVAGDAVLNLLLHQATVISSEPPEGGMVGRDLDAVAPVPTGAPPMSYLLAAWVTTHDSPGAERARALMGTRDWKHAQTVIFPTLVIFLFVADLAHEARIASGGVTAAFPGGRTALAGGDAGIRPALTAVRTAEALCDQVAGFVSDTLAKLFEKLKSGSDGILAVIWNVAVGLAKDVLVGLATSFSASVLATIRTAAGVIGTLAYMTSLLREWSVTAQADDNEKAFGIDQPGPMGVVTISVDASNQTALPGEVISCVNLANANVPSAEPPGKPVTWELISVGSTPLATQLTQDSTVRADRTAQFTYQVESESGAAAKGPEVSSALVVKATVERISGADLTATIEILLGKLITLPQAAKDLLKPVTDTAIEALGDLARPSSFWTVQVLHHETPECPVEDGRWGGKFGQDVILKTSNGAGARVVSSGTMTFDVVCTDVTGGHMTFNEWVLAAGLDETGVLVTCAGDNLTYTVTKGTVSRPEGGLPVFELEVETGGKVSCDPSVPFAGPAGTTVVTLRATAEHVDELLGIADNILPLEDPRVVKAFDQFAASGGTLTATTAWTLSLGPPPTPFPGGSATPSTAPTATPPVASGAQGILTIDGIDHPFAVSACAFSKAEAEAAGLGDVFSDDTRVLIDGVTGDSEPLTVDVRSNAFLGDSVELYRSDLTTVSWISSTSLLSAAGLPSPGFTVKGRRVTWDVEFFDRHSTLDLSKHAPGHLDVTCP